MDADLVNALAALKQRDETVRALLVAEGRLYGDYAEEMQRVHTDNAMRLDALVAEHGWPTVPLVGLECSRAAWSIAQHANCTPALQRKFLALLTKAYQAGTVPGPQLAMLTDRVRANEQRPLLYAMILDWDENGELSCEIEDPANLDARRHALGLPAMVDDDLAGHRARVEAEGSRPPADFAEARRKASEWARRAGWVE